MLKYTYYKYTCTRLQEGSHFFMYNINRHSSIYVYYTQYTVNLYIYMYMYIYYAEGCHHRYYIVYIFYRRQGLNHPNSCGYVVLSYRSPKTDSIFSFFFLPNSKFFNIVLLTYNTLTQPSVLALSCVYLACFIFLRHYIHSIVYIIYY